MSFRGEGRIDAPLPLVLSVVLDAERVGEWMSGMAESDVLRWIHKPDHYLQFTRFDAPWPVSDRVFLSRVKLEVEPGSFLTHLRYYDTERRLPPELGVQGYAGGSYYVLRPADGGRQADFIGVSVADPRGYIPTWLVNWMGGYWAHDTLSALRRQVRRDDVGLLSMLEPLFAEFGASPGRDRPPGRAPVARPAAPAR